MKRLMMVLVMVVFLCSCATAHIMNAPAPAKDRLPSVGTPRTEVLASLGTPKKADTDSSGRKYEVFAVPEGLSKGQKSYKLPALWVLDVMSLGLTEPVFWYMLKDAPENQIRVWYDDQDRVVESIVSWGRVK